MRIIALPLARVRVPPDTRLKYNTNSLLVFYHFDLTLPHAEPKDRSWHRKLLKDVTNKATGLWDSLRKAPKGSWKLRAYELGERIADQIEFEELALGSVDPSLGPAVPTGASTKQVNDAGKDSSRLHSLPRIPLTYPPSLYTAGADHTLHPPLAHLRTLLASHGPRHRKGFILWLLVAPLTVPITLIPLIPNLPLFFCAWRSWSHYRAYRSSQYLSALLNRGLIEPSPSAELDRLYASSISLSRTPSSPLPFGFTSSSEKGLAFINTTGNSKSEATLGTEVPQSERTLFAVEAMPQILEMLSLSESVAKDIHRAINQVCIRLEKSS